MNPSSTDRHVFIADVHLRREEIAKRDALVRLMDELARPGAHLYILGDLFDVWIGPAQFAAEPEMAPVLEAMGRVVASGAKLTFFHGNRDFYMGNFLTRRLGAETVRNASIVEIGGRRTYLTHGEFLCGGDQIHHFMRGLLRSPFLATLYHFFPVHMKYGSSRIYRSISLRRNPTARRRSHGIELPALRRLLRKGVEVVICGHIHEASDRTIREAGRELRLIVLPPWTDRGWALEHALGEFAMRRIDFT
jgi:UDP-2,3-diacylglucosamine hydrolase